MSEILSIFQSMMMIMEYLGGGNLKAHLRRLKLGYVQQYTVYVE